jgi:hypothetical protein
MTKRDFIQRLFIAAKPPREKFAAALVYAEAVWEFLSRNGYGAPEPTGPRESVDWYGKLDERQRYWFDQFWEAFGYKKDRNGAAMRWHQLGELDQDQYRHIVEAAKAEAAQQLAPGQVRKMAQGWLNEKRWTDYAPTKTQEKRQQTGLLSGFKATLRHLERLNEAAPNPRIQKQIDDLKAKIAAEENAHA